MENYSFKGKTIDEIKQGFNIVHNHRFDYSNFTNYTNSEKLIEIVCEKHGIYKQSCYLHMKGHKCRKCSDEERVLKSFDKNKNDFLNKFNSKFQNLLAIVGEYKNNSTRIDYCCQKCNVTYSNTPNKLLSKKNVGCAYCYGNGKNKQHLAYFEKYKEMLVKDVGFIYVIKLSNDKEDFIKIGITKEESCKTRFEKIPYTIDIEGVFENSMYNCFKIEQMMLNDFKLFKYSPATWFGGATECLKNECLTDLISNIKLLNAESNGQI